MVSSLVFHVALLVIGCCRFDLNQDFDGVWIVVRWWLKVVVNCLAVWLERCDEAVYGVLFLLGFVGLISWC